MMSAKDSRCKQVNCSRTSSITRTCWLQTDSSERLVTNVTMQEEMLNKIYEDHQVITKCVAKAQQSMWWPGLTKQTKCRFQVKTVQPVHIRLTMHQSHC